MEIRVRDLDPYTVKMIDEQAKKKKQSRQQYLKNVLENLSATKELKEQEERFIKLNNQVLAALNQNTLVMQKMIRIIDELTLMEDGE
ncbi:hypothetical protein NSQ59_27710 [Margalitia sp. FSL K6-0131]|uniref:hypothetical protein n=1 Tax=Margalitia sp. FSL K6-0131 TaxID=2954604 RepID=UPI0030F98F1A